MSSIPVHTRALYERIAGTPGSLQRLRASIAARTTRPASAWLDRTLAWLRWTILATLLLLAVAWPVPDRTGQRLWIAVLAFCVYNTAIELLRWRVPRLRSFAWVPVLDLPVAAALYALDAQPDGPLLAFVFLAVVTAGFCYPVRWAAVHAVIAAGLIAAMAPTLPGWSETPGELRRLTARLVILCAAGIGGAVLTRHLDIAERQTRAIRDEATRREALATLRADFIASVSHDLRTPLTAMRAGIGMIETKVTGRLEPDERALLANARRNTDRLRLLIDDLLACNQLETGTLRLQPAPVDVREIMTDAVAAVYPLLQEKRQPLELHLPQPLRLRGDQRRLEQLLVNLLANAHYHTPPGTRIAASGRLAAGEVVLTVADAGPGIPPDELEDIFRRYHRSSAIGGGSGLGLAIAAGIARLHGGRIWAESAPGRGSTFHVALPADGGGGPR